MSKHSILPILTWVMLAILSGCNNAPSDNAAPKTAATANSEATKTVTASELAAARSADGVCALDTVDNAENSTLWTVKKSAISLLRGWVATSRKQLPTQLTIVLKAEQAYGFAAKTGVPRADVAQALGSAELASAGYNFAADFSNIPVGTYHAFALTSSPTGIEICNFQRQILITP